jgi:LysM repeat protein
MKKYPLLLTAILAVSTLLAQSDAPLYLMFTKDCMNQLDYQYTYTRTDVPVYAVSPSANEQFILTAAAKGIEAKTLQKGVQTCHTFDMNAAFVDAINRQTRQVYIVHQTARGYLMMPIRYATQVSKSGTYYMVNAPNYSFILDTSKLVNETNLATANSLSNVYFTGIRYRNCRKEYAFRREPTRGGLDRGDFEFVPGLGITSDRSGTNAADALGNQLDLLKVNNMILDDYLNAVCAGQKKEEPTTISPYTPPLGYDSDFKNTRFNEGNKEEEAMRQNLPPAPTEHNRNRASTDPSDPFANCDVKPGEGYHVVLPKESLRAIADHYGVSMENIKKWNNIKDPNKISICQPIWYVKPPQNKESHLRMAKGIAPTEHSRKHSKIMDQSAYREGGQMEYKQPQPEQSAKGEDLTRPNEYGRSKAKEAIVLETHTVQKGENLYRISKKYGCPESCVRRANNMGATGDPGLRIGQVLVLNGCDCKGATSSAVTPSEAQPPAAKTRTEEAPTFIGNPRTETTPVEHQRKKEELSRETPTSIATPQAKKNALDNGELPTTPVEHNRRTDQTAKVVEDVRPEVQKLPEVSDKPAEMPKFDYPKEYIVKQGDTLRSIAISTKSSAAEILLINEGLEADKPLQPGQRILVPYRIQ